MHLNGHQQHILCINHSPEILSLLRDLLEDEGYRVSTLISMDRNLEEVVALEPDVITIDYMWAASDNEWTFLTMLTMDPRTRDIPVVLCTGAVSQAREMEQHLATIGVTVVLKPFNIDVLIHAVQKALNRGPVATESAKLLEG
jgi:two-component system, chemotaxis family, response regulator PixG